MRTRKAVIVRIEESEREAFNITAKLHGMSANELAARLFREHVEAVRRAAPVPQAATIKQPDTQPEAPR